MPGVLPGVDASLAFESAVVFCSLILFPAASLDRRFMPQDDRESRQSFDAFLHQESPAVEELDDTLIALRRSSRWLIEGKQAQTMPMASSPVLAKSVSVRGVTLDAAFSKGGDSHSPVKRDEVHSRVFGVCELDGEVYAIHRHGECYTTRA